MYLLRKSKSWKTFWSLVSSRKFRILFGIVLLGLFLVWLEFKIFDLPFLSSSQKYIFLFLLFQINLALALTLLYFIFRYLFKTFSEIGVKKISKSIKIKLFVIYCLSIIFPSVVLVFGSFLFFKKTIDYWLKEFMEEKLLTGLITPQHLLQQTERELLNKAQTIAEEYISKVERIRSSELRERYRYFMGLDSIEVFDLSGSLLKKTYSSRISEKIGIAPSTLEKLKKEGLPTSEVTLVRSDPLVRVFFPCESKDGRPLILAVGKFVVWENLSEPGKEVERKYLRMFKRFLMLSGLLVLLLIVFIGIWVGSKIGKTLTEPLQNLIFATQRISRKEFDLETLNLERTSEDEIGALIKAFKEMTQKLKNYEEEIKRYNAFLKTILDSIPLGIFILDEKLSLRYQNQGLARLLSDYQFSEPEKLIEILDIKNLLKEMDLSKPFYKIFSWELANKTYSLGVTILELEHSKEREYMFILENLEEKENLKKLSFWKEVALKVSHEIKNPLTPIKLSVERLKKQLETELSGEKREILLKTTTIIEKYIEELRKLATDFHYFTKGLSPELEKGFILESIVEVVNLYEIAYPEVKIHIRAEDEGEGYFDKFQLRRVWINLLDNSIRAMQEKGEITVTITRENGFIVVRFRDTGKGVPEEVERKIKEGDMLSLKDLGTGLMMVYSIIQAHKGLFDISRKEEGTEITIKIPANLKGS